MNRHSLALSIAAVALAVLVLGVSVGHPHAHGQKNECTLCQAAPQPEILDLASLLETPRPATFEASAPSIEVNLTLFEVGSSLSFRGPPV